MIVHMLQWLSITGKQSGHSVSFSCNVPPKNSARSSLQSIQSLQKSVNFVTASTEAMMHYMNQHLPGPQIVASMNRLSHQKSC